MEGIAKILWDFKSTLLLVLLPLLSLPLPLVLRSTEASCGFCIIVMAGYWISECIPLAVTAFLPLILFPMMGIMSADDVSGIYFKDTNWLFVGGLIIAIAVEHTRLHRRIALSVLKLVGTSPRRLMIGFMIPTYFLSMWISNTATTAMMIPIANAVLSELKNEDENHEKDLEFAGSLHEDDIELQMPANRDDKESSSKPVVTVFSNRLAIEHDDEKPSLLGTEDSTSECVIEEDKPSKSESQDNVVDVVEEREASSVEKGITICVPYAASIGGITTLTGTGGNIILAGQYEILFPDAVPQINFANWMAYHLPLSLMMLLLTYLWLMYMYLGIRCDCGGPKNTKQDMQIRQLLNNEYAKLGNIKWGEITVVIILTSTVLLWFFREPGFMPGWSVIFKDGYVSDGTVAVTMATLLFLLPSRRPAFLGKRPEDPDDFRPVPAVLDWKTVNTKMPWNVVFLLGGGFALAAGATESGFADWLANQLAVLDGIPEWSICLIVTLITCLFTECTSNVATASLFIPIIAQLAQVIEVHPLYLLLPTVIATSLAFMLPVATPPNAIAFSYGYLKVIDLVKAGWFLNLLGVALLMLFINTYAIVIYDVGEFPEWASLNYTAAAS